MRKNRSTHEHAICARKSNPAQPKFKWHGSRGPWSGKTLVRNYSWVVFTWWWIPETRREGNREHVFSRRRCPARNLFLQRVRRFRRHKPSPPSTEQCPWTLCRLPERVLKAREDAKVEDGEGERRRWVVVSRLEPAGEKGEEEKEIWFQEDPWKLQIHKWPRGHVDGRDA